jgi:tetratricopeptide (TPR) repeat protein
MVNVQVVNGPQSAILPIVALARSGAMELAWQMFCGAGLDKLDSDPAVLSVKGRLLKDQAIAAKGNERRRLYGVSAAAYARAAKLSGQTYPLINAATLSLLAGRRAAARKLARELLHSPKREEAETPYWRAATLAEAHLLLGDVEKAKAALSEAMTLAPRAYEDHASTLRQFALILQELRLDDSWLDACRPPRTAHFAGHIWMSGDDPQIARNLRAIIERERIGFAYGALAAGADILIAEALLEANAELHLVLPSAVAEFRKMSVVPSGASWARRFDAILKHACSVQIIGPETDPRSQLAIQLASEVAMGLASMQGEMLRSGAVQLLVLAPEKSRDSVSERLGRIWKKGGRRQHVLKASRAIASRGPSQHEGEAECLAAFLHIEMGEADSSCAESLRRLAAA